MAGERERIDSMLQSIRASADSIEKELDSVLLVPKPEPAKDVIKVNVGDSVQKAYDTLLPTGGTILLAPGIHNGELKLAERPTDAKLITFSSDSTNLPADGKRTGPEYLPAMGQIFGVTAAKSPVRILNKSRNTAFVNVAFGPPVTKSFTTIEMGGDKNSMPTPADRPDGFMFDRVFVFGDPTAGAHRGIALNASNVTVKKSYFKDIFEPGRDSQAVSAWNGGQNIVLDDNYFEGGAENVMFGGSDSASPEMACQDIVMKYCHLKKQFNDAWKTASIKTLFEIKHVKRMLVDSCLFENNWSRDWPTGVAIMLKACNGENIESWATCEDMTMTNLLIRNVGSVFGFIGKNDSGRISDWMRRVTIRNVLAHTINLTPWLGTGRGAPFANGCEEFFVMDHITMHTNQHSWMNTWFDSGITKAPGKFVLTNSVMAESSYGYFSQSNGIGFPAIEKDWTGTQISGNAWRQGARAQGVLPVDNLRLPPANWDASFDSDHGVIPDSAIAQVKTTDGKLPGADVQALKAIFGTL